MPYETFVGAGAETFCDEELLLAELEELLVLSELEELLFELLPLTESFCPGYMKWEEMLFMFINVL